MEHFKIFTYFGYDFLLEASQSKAKSIIQISVEITLDE